MPGNLKDIVNKCAGDAARNHVSEVKTRTKSVLDEATGKQGVKVLTLPAVEQAKVRQGSAPILEKLAQANAKG